MRKQNEYGEMRPGWHNRPDDRTIDQDMLATWKRETAFQEIIEGDAYRLYATIIRRYPRMRPIRIPKMVDVSKREWEAECFRFRECIRIFNEKHAHRMFQ